MKSRYGLLLVVMALGLSRASGIDFSRCSALVTHHTIFEYVTTAIQTDAATITVAQYGDINQAKYSPPVLDPPCVERFKKHSLRGLVVPFPNGYSPTFVFDFLPILYVDLSIGSLHFKPIKNMIPQNYLSVDSPPPNHPC